MPTKDFEPFLKWFQANNGTIDSSSVAITVFPTVEGDRGLIALKDIPEGQILFAVPRSLTLSTRTSLLPGLFGAEQWESLGLGEGWVGLILCMMWETMNGTSSKWREYLETLPTRFDTPMFWGESDLSELKGTALVEKLGREDAEQTYREKLLPAVQSRPDIFPIESISLYYSLETYHIMGSRILSRSFNVEKSEVEDEQEDPTANATHGGSMDVDPVEILENRDDNNTDVEVVEEDEVEDPSDVTMVPMADMLNARYGSENAKLFHEQHELKMITTKPVKAGEQILNTYGDLPNSELLRRYGHVDFLPLPQGQFGNPGDVVELRADIVVSVISQQRHSSSEFSQERIDWWLEEGGDDVFVLETDLELPSALISLIRLLILPPSEWEKVKNKGKPPKAKIDDEVLSIACEVLVAREKEYPTDLKTDEESLVHTISLNKRHAIIVRIGEKRLLLGLLAKVRELQAVGKGRNKRKIREDKTESSTKKPRIIMH